MQQHRTPSENPVMTGSPSISTRKRTVKRARLSKPLKTETELNRFAEIAEATQQLPKGASRSKAVAQISKKLKGIPLSKNDRMLATVLVVAREVALENKVPIQPHTKSPVVRALVATSRRKQRPLVPA